jgi:hypothetical protein
MEQIYPPAGFSRAPFAFKRLFFILLSLTLLAISKSNAQVGTNLHYDGIDDYVEIPAGAQSIVSNVTGDFTIETWVIWDGGNQSFPRIFDFGNDPSNWIVLTAALPFAPSGPRFMIRRNGFPDQLVDATVTLTPGTWNHIAVTLDATTDIATIYINGVASGTTAGFTDRLSDLGVTTNNWFGRSEFGTDPFFPGNIEEFRISDIVRYTGNFTPSLTQFAVDANTVALYHFNEGGGQTTADATGNNADGILGGTMAIESSDPTWVFGSVLPVKLTDFTATLNSVNKTVEIKWIASTDQPTEFTLERSSNGSAFTRLNTTSRTNATTGLETFTFRDLHPLTGRSYYRLKYSEAGKPAFYSRTIPVNLSTKGTFVIYPNPVKGGMINIELLKAFTGHVQIRLMNSAGAVVVSLSKDANKESQFQISRAGLPAGSYILEITTGDLKQSQMIVCQ